LLQLTSFLFVGPSGAEPITVKHAQGGTVLPAKPKTVLTLDFAALETLDALGVEVAGVPSALIPAHLAKYEDAKFAKIGTLFDPDYEAINAVKPDLIIVSARSAPKYKDLTRIAPTIDLSTDDGAFLASAFRNARTLGKIFGKTSEIDARIAALEARIQSVKIKARDAGTGLIILATGGRLSAYGPRSRFGTLHSDFGIVPAVESLDSAVHGQGVSFELILKANPDWLFVIDRDTAVGRPGQPAAKLLDNALVARTNAWKQGRVVYLDPVRWYLVGGGIVSLQVNADQIAQALHVTP
jgi:iron complex transport system substrate-binding protein